MWQIHFRVPGEQALRMVVAMSAVLTLAAKPVFTDNAFGYFSASGILTVPIPGNAAYGGWNFHAGVEFQKLGETTKAFNNGKGEKAIATVGMGFSY